MKYLGLWYPGLRIFFWKICKTLRPPLTYLMYAPLNWTLCWLLICKCFWIKLILRVFIYLNTYRKVYLALQTGKNYSSSGNLQNIFNKNWIYQKQPRSIVHEIRFSYRQNYSKSSENTCEGNNFLVSYKLNTGNVTKNELLQRILW